MTKPYDPESILYAFTVEPKHDRTTLERYLSQYPELSEELIDLASELRLGDALCPAPLGAAADAESEASWREFLACSPKPGGEKAENPFAIFQREAFAGLAEALNVPRSFLSALRDGLVAAASIPEGFVRRLAGAMGAPVELIRGYFLNPRPAQVARAFKSDGKPCHQGQTTFRELVENTEMTEEQRRLLLQECSDDGLV